MAERSVMEVAHPLPPGIAPVSNACRYIGMCPGLTEEDLSRGSSGVRQHLWQHHHGGLIHDSLGRYICQWSTSGETTCLEHISDLDNLARHIVSVHLRLMMSNMRRGVCEDGLLDETPQEVYLKSGE